MAWATRDARPTQPLIMCEYIHAMGNSCGDLDEYWAAIRTHPGLQGGFVVGLGRPGARAGRMPDGTERLAYGGDFGDEPNDGPFCMNGLVAADRTPHPSLLELAKVVQPVARRGGRRGARRARGHERARLRRPVLAAARVGGRGRRRRGGGRRAEPLDWRPARPPSCASRCPLPVLDAGERAAPHARASRRRRPAVGGGRARRRLGAVRARVGARAVDRARAARRTRSLDELDPTLALWRAPIDNETFGPAPRRAVGRAGLRDPARARRRAATDASARRRARGHPRGRRARRARRHPARRRAARRRRRASHAVEWLGRGPHECYSDRRAERTVGRWTHARSTTGRCPTCTRRRAATASACAGCGSSTPTARRSLTVDELDDLAGHRRAAGPTRRSPTPGTSRTCRPATTCYVWIDAAPPRRRLRRRAGPTPRPRTASAPARTAGPTGSAERPRRSRRTRSRRRRR